MISNIKPGITLSILLATYLSAQAQKLPGVQLNSLSAPAGIKIDGRATEWGNRFQAYNKATDIYYTMANDSANLYLAIQAKDPVIIHKILGGSIALTLHRSVKKNAEPVAVIFPLLPVDISERLAACLQQRIALASAKTGNVVYASDSLLLLINTAMINNLKQIKVKGISSLTDTMLSVYNDAGIKVQALFDTNNALTCELAVPVKYLKLSGALPARFSYQIKLNEMYANHTGMAVGLDGKALPTGSFTIVYTGPQTERQTLMSTTDFEGEYTLAGR